MKKFSLILLIVISNCYSQEINTDIREYASFKSGTTYFVKASDKKYNAIVSDILAKYWTVNKFEMINSGQVEKLKGENSFFVDQVEYSFSRTGGTTGALNMEYGVPKLALFREYKKGSPKGVLSLIQIDKMSATEILVAIQLLQSQINFVFELNTKKDYDIKDLLDEVSERKQKSIKEKTLYLNRSHLKDGIDTDDEFKKIYSHKFKIVNPEEIDRAIENQDAGVVYAKVINYRNLKFVLFINAKNSELLYGRVMTGFNQAQIGPKFFKDIDEK